MVSVKPLFELEPERTGEAVESIKQWIRTWFAKNGGTTAVLGMSGGKDSTVCAKLLVDSLGEDNVVGVFMPNGIQSDIQDAIDAAAFAPVSPTQGKSTSQAPTTPYPTRWKGSTATPRREST